MVKLIKYYLHILCVFTAYQIFHFFFKISVLHSLWGVIFFQAVTYNPSISEPSEFKLVLLKG